LSKGGPSKRDRCEHAPDSRLPGNPLPPAWRRANTKGIYYGVLNGEPAFTRALSHVFDALEEHYGPHLFRGVGSDLELLLAILVEALDLAHGTLVESMARQCLDALQRRGHFDYPADSPHVQAWTSDERRGFDALHLKDLIGAVASRPSHPWRGRVTDPPEYLRHPLRRGNLTDFQRLYREAGEQNWLEAADTEYQRHVSVNPEADPNVQKIVADFCKSQGLPTVPPDDDGPKDVWLTYREWRPRGGTPRLRMEGKWVVRGEPPSRGTTEPV
jgi:hypothetical protein